MATRTAVKAAMKKRLQRRNQAGEESPVQTGAGGVPRVTRTPVPHRGLEKVTSGTTRAKYGKQFRESQKLAPTPNIQAGAVPTDQQKQARTAFKESVAQRQKSNRNLIRQRYGKSKNWQKKVYGAGYKRGTVGKLGTQLQSQRAHILGQKSSIYKLGKQLKALEPTEAQAEGTPSDKSKALEKRISQLEKNLTVSTKKLGTTKAEKQKYIDKRNKMLQNLYTVSHAKPGSLERARKAETVGRLKEARGKEARGGATPMPKGAGGVTAPVKNRGRSQGGMATQHQKPPSVAPGRPVHKKKPQTGRNIAAKWTPRSGMSYKEYLRLKRNRNKRGRTDQNRR